MSDFYPVLSRAVAKLANDDAQSRQQLYAHARKFVISVLLQQQPPRSESEIIQKQAALERAILLVEQKLKSGQSQAQTNRTSVRPAPHRGAVLEMTVAPAVFTQQKSPKAGNDTLVTWPPWPPLEPSAESNMGARTNIGLLTVRRRPQADRPARPAYRDPTLITLVSVVAIFSFTAVMSIPVVAIYAPRLLWLVQHVVDNPRLIIPIATAFGALLLLSLPIFGSRRKRTAFGFLWQSIYPMLRA